ncbi:EamA family transporter [Penaeicola halotolerans]|uniref:EamA family transporter n=1 Tax=Penaeicola halotolerans TaxID=2793196 RepID=UPI0021CFE335|nr:DMT family transporter [Penaeicola halotolerans]
MLVSGRIGNALNPLHKSALMLTGACILIFVIFPPTFIWNGAITAGLWKWGIPLALFGTVIPPIFFAIGIPKTGVGLSSIISSAELPVAVLMSSIILGESVSAIQWLGVAIILSAIILSNAKKIKLSRK